MELAFIRNLTPSLSSPLELSNFFFIPGSERDGNLIIVNSSNHIISLTLQNNTFLNLPSNIAALSYLSYLLITGCSLSSLPDTIGKLERLKFLDLSQNQLSQLPSTLMNLRYFTSLNLENNAFEDYPRILNQLPCLQNVRLNHNPIRTLPWEIHKNPAIIFISNNYGNDPIDFTLEGESEWILG